jgi:PAS domain S-box-containing protein
MAEVQKGEREPQATQVAFSVLLACVGYYLGGTLGLSVRFPSLDISGIWPPNAILLAALLLAPPRRWGWYLLAVLPTHLLLAPQYPSGVPWATVFCHFAGNVLQSLLAALAVRRFIGAPPRFDTLRSQTTFILIAAIAAPAVAATVVASLFRLTGWSTDFWHTWRFRFLANVFPILTLTPLIVMAAEGGIKAARQAPRWLYAESGLLALLLFAVGLHVFRDQSPGPGSHQAMLYAPLPLLLWAAVRFGLSGLCLSLLMVAFLSLGSAYAGRGPFITESPAENVLTLQLFLLAISLPLVLLSALMQEQRQTAAALRASSRKARHQFAQLAAIYRTAPVGLVYFDTDLRYVSINDRLAEIHGLPAEAHRGRTLREVVPEVADELELLLRRVIATGIPLLDWEVRSDTSSQSDGERVWLSSYYPVKDEQGTVLGLNTVVQEITERKRAEEALRESRRRIEWLLDSVEGIVWEGDPQTFLFTYVSQKAERLLGYPVGQWLSGPTFWLDHLHPEDRDWAFEFCKSMTEAGKFHDFEYRMIAADGRVVWLRDIVSVDVLDGKPVASHGIIVDVTQRKQAEEALRASHQQIQDLAGRLITAQETERSRIARELHDDINQRAAALAIAHSTLRRCMPPASSDLQEEVTRLQQQTIALSEAVRHLCHELHPGVLQHSGLAAALQAHCDGFARQHELEVAFRSAGNLKDVPAEVALCLYRVSQEALHNVEAHAQANRVEVALSRTAAGLELAVCDDGTGFNPEAVVRGGLGLITMEERVRMLQGTMQILTQEQHGTELRVHVPLGAPLSPLQETENEASTSEAGR